MSDARRGQIGGGGRSEKTRTYNYKENRVTGHRIGLTLYHLDRVLQGDLDELLDALPADERAHQLSGSRGASRADAGPQPGPRRPLDPYRQPFVAVHE